MKTYNLLIKLLKFLSPIICLLNKKIKLITIEQNNNAHKLKTLNLDKNKKTIWFHVASAGEFLQASTLINLFSENNFNIIVSYTSISCKQWLKKYNIYDSSFILPIDTKKNILEIINLINPAALILTRYDIWPNLIDKTYNNKIPIFLISATLNLKKLKYLKKFYTNLYSKIKIIFTVNEIEDFKFKKLGLNNTIVSGDTKYDYVINRINTELKPSLKENLDKIKNSYEKIIVLGSSWSKDENIAVPAFKELLNKYSNLLLIIVPHELDRINKIKKKLIKNNLNFSLYSDLNTKYNFKVLLVDAMGILVDLYRIADFAFIGSGSAGVHNVLEAYFLNIPIAFRNTYFNSNEAVLLVEKNLAKVIEDKNNFINFINNTNKNNLNYNNYFKTGSSLYTYNTIKNILS